MSVGTLIWSTLILCTRYPNISNGITNDICTEQDTYTMTEDVMRAHVYLFVPETSVSMVDYHV